MTIISPELLLTPPELRPIQIDPRKLLLDPNNPRFITSEVERTPDERIGDAAEIIGTAAKMWPGGDPFRIQMLMDSIEQNGWQAVDSIFVRTLAGTDKFLVLEGNRRVTAIHRLLQKADLKAKTREQLERIEVMEVIGHDNPAELQQQISYLLGVRHHGALRRWSPFAQARNILECYLRLAAQTAETFRYDENVGEKVASALSIKTEDVRKRLLAYRAMGSLPKYAGVPENKILESHYSLFEEALVRKSSKLADYFEVDHQSFELKPDSAKRFEHLCKFADDRKDSAIDNPQEWRALEKILNDEDAAKAVSNLHLVEAKMQKPSQVWAERAEQLRKLEWATWLEKVRVKIQRVQLGQVNLDDSRSADVISRLDNLLSTLANASRDQ